MTTLDSWIAETRDHLEGGAPQLGNQLAANYTPGSGTLTVAHATGNIGEGSFLSIGTNVLLVTAVDTVTKIVTVVGGQRGSTDQAATTGALVRVNPRFTDFQIVREINNTLRQLSSPVNGLYQIGQLELAYNSVVEGYGLSGVTGLVRVLEVRRETYGPSLAWPAIENEAWDVVRTAPSDFGTESVLRVVGANTGLAVQVVYAKQFTSISYVTSTDITTTGIPDSAADIPPLGAAVRLMTGREVSRNNVDAQGDSRRANEVPPGAIAASSRGLQAWFLQRVREEAARLKQQFALSI